LHDTHFKINEAILCQACLRKHPQYTGYLPVPSLFLYIKHPQIPNTTDFVEGAVNATLQEKLRFHRGLKLPKRRILVAHFLAAKQ